MSDLKASVGMTRKWNAREAGREVAQNTIEQLDGNKPNFFLLFSTIHYKDTGGFKELLAGVWDILPENTPLIGGTVIGFLNNYGCFARGASALAVSSKDLEVSIGFGNNTKRSPKKAAEQSSGMIKKEMNKSGWKNKFLLNFISGPSSMKIPGQGYKKVVDSGIISKFIVQAFGISQYLFQKGFGREDEIFEEIVKQLPEYHMILGTAMDDYTGISNYQFYNNKVFTNSIVNLGIGTNLDIDVCTTHGMKKTDIKFKITKLSRNKHIIHEINNNPAVPELYNILNWPDGFLNEKTMGYTILYYPISVKRHGQEVPVVMPYFLKNSVMTPCIIDKGDVSILTISGNNIIKAMEENLKSFNNIEPEFGIFSTCMTILVTLGYKMNILQDEILKYFGKKPFLMFVSAGEGTYSPIKNFTYANMSFNTVVFGKNKYIN